MAEKLKAHQKVEFDHPRYGKLTGYVQRVAKDGSWAMIDARTGIGMTFETKKYSGSELDRWKPVAD